MMRLRSMLFVPGDSDKNFARDWLFFVRVNPFDTGMTFDDMAAVVKPGLEDLLIPRADGAADIARIAEAINSPKVF